MHGNRTFKFDLQCLRLKLFYDKCCISYVYIYISQYKYVKLFFKVLVIYLAVSPPSPNRSFKNVCRELEIYPYHVAPHIKGDKNTNGVLKSSLRCRYPKWRPTTCITQNNGCQSFCFQVIREIVFETLTF